VKRSTKIHDLLWLAGAAIALIIAIVAGLHYFGKM